MGYVIGIDVGTTGTKALLFTEKGEVVKTMYCGYEIISERPGYAEQKPQDWYQAVCRTVRGCVEGLNEPSQVLAISISAQGGTMVAVDKEGLPVDRAVSWLDRRAKKEAEELNQKKPEHYYYRNTGWRLNDGYPLSQIEWMKKHKPDVFAGTELFLSPLSYLNLCLTGKAVSDYTNEGISNMENLHLWDWEPAVFDDLSLTKKNLPGLQPAGSVIGTLSKAAASDLGLTEKTMVINGGYDQYCAALGLGAMHKGDIMLSTGTAWVVIAVTDRLLFDEETFISPCMHIVPGCFGGMASLETGGVSLDWFRDKIAGDRENKETYEVLNREIGKRSIGADGLLFYPHFAGSTCPYWSKSSKGAFLGLTLFHDRYHMARAVMEGVVFELCEILDAYKKQGQKLHTIKMVGGAAKSRVWTQMIADISGLSVEIYGNADAAAVGAGILAAKGIGCYGDFSQAAKAFHQEVERIEPEKQAFGQYQKIRRRYHSGFMHLKAFYEEESR